MTTPSVLDHPYAITVPATPAELPAASPAPAAERRPPWSVPARIGVFALAAVLYTWNLAANGTANSFYTAAVKSGTESWKAFFFGSLDPGNFITVDKPPAALWVPELAARVFGFSTWTVLLPEALAGVASVMVLYHLVRRWSGELAAVLAALAFALTPAATLMFRYNNPDALLTLLLLLAAWAFWVALERASTWRLVLSGSLIGFAFLTKTLEAFIVLPVLVVLYLVCGKPHLWRRVRQTLWFGLAVLVSSGWWVAVVQLWPAASRPYIGGSTDNSELNLIFGYNGFSRIFGSGGGPGGPSFAGTPGWLRMFNDLLGGEISWLLPLAVVGLVAGLYATRRAARTDATRAGWLLWGGWTLAFFVVFSNAKGIFHPYYTVVMAPGVGALVGAGAVTLFRLGRQSRRWAPVLPLAVAASAFWAAVLLDRVPGYDPGLATFVLAAGVVAAVVLALVLFDVVRGGAVALGAGVLAAASLLAGPAAYSLTTARTVYSGGGVTAGPSTGGGGPGGLGGAAAGGTAGVGGPPTGAGAGAFGPGAGGRPSGTGGTPPAGALPSGTGSGRAASGFPGAVGGSASGARGGAAGPGGASVDKALVAFLEAHQGSATYLLVVAGSQTSAPIIIESGRAVITIGGFNGSDPAPTLAQFEQLVAEGKVHYVLVTGSGGGPGGGGPGGGTSTASAIFSWVESHGTVVPAKDYGGSSGGGTLYVVSSSTAG
ncbi:MAG TPA: glycosyltransferase family 39 protein [Acidimicrobiales bacterium]|nr:glycosyltransferase family 39 protein [Acidimicrobiales bacterium]